MSQPPERVSVVRASDRRPGPPTPGMQRQEAFASDTVWAGFVRNEPGTASGWHHHGEFDTVVYVVGGRLRMESGPDGSDAVDAGPDDFVFVPKGVVHRESNPSSGPTDVVVVRSGHGESTINVDGPAPA